jgi:hypothetical protein
MNTEEIERAERAWMHNKQVRRIHRSMPDGGEIISAHDQTTLLHLSFFCGDHQENWVIQYENGTEIARFNTRYLSMIEWV